jgi:glucose/arabinose dehydrogenase
MRKRSLGMTVIFVVGCGSAALPSGDGAATDGSAAVVDGSPDSSAAIADGAPAVAPDGRLEIVDGPSAVEDRPALDGPLLPGDTATAEDSGVDATTVAGDAGTDQAAPRGDGPGGAVDAPPLVPDSSPVVPDDGGTGAARFCDLGADVAGATVPGGFCLRRYATVKVARTMVFAPNGDLLVGAPSVGTAGGASGGPGAIVVLSDDNHDGVAEMTNFLEGVTDVHGLTLGDGYLYFTTQKTVWRTPYQPGQRREQAGKREDLGLPSGFGQGGRWTHGLAHSISGALYVSRGQYGSCGGIPGGEISRVGMGQLSAVASGFRNPMYMRCHFRDDACAATDLGEDGQPGAKEKLVGIRSTAADYGYPCCYGKDAPVPVAPSGACTAVRLEDASFVLSDTPFGFDWEREVWPDPYKGAVFVALHGSFYTSPPWAGARVVFAPVDPNTHMPIEGWRDFVGGFGPGGSALERPSDVAFSPDGRMFFADDQGGGIYWVAPANLARPK